jgi:hypothetical protein
MQYIHHLVMTTDKRPINPSRLRYVQVEGSYNECPTLAVGDTLNIVGRENHRQRAPREVVGNRQIAAYRHVKVADRGLCFAVAIAPAIATIGLFPFFFGKPADRVDLCCAVRTVTGGSPGTVQGRDNASLVYMCPAAGSRKGWPAARLVPAVNAPTRVWSGREQELEEKPKLLIRFQPF